VGAVQDEGGDLAVCVVEDPLSLDGGGKLGVYFQSLCICGYGFLAFGASGVDRWVPG